MPASPASSRMTTALPHEQEALRGHPADQLIDPLPRAADHLRQLVLGDDDVDERALLARRPVHGGEHEETARQPDLDRIGGILLDGLQEDRLAQAAEPHEGSAYARMPQQERLQVGLPEMQEHCGVVGGRIMGPRQQAERGGLPEPVAGTVEIEDRLPPLLRHAADADGADDDRVDAVGDVPARVEPLARSQRPPPGAGQKLFANVIRQALEPLVDRCDGRMERGYRRHRRGLRRYVTQSAPFASGCPSRRAPSDGRAPRSGGRSGAPARGQPQVTTRPRALAPEDR